MRRTFKPYFGSVSSGTMLPEDLIPAFASELDSILRKLPRGQPRKAHRGLVREAEATTDYEGDVAAYVLDALFTALNDYAPAYGYFGSHPGDGADFGFWLSSFFTENFDGLKLDAGDSAPSGYRGEILYVTDHGNITLTVKTGRKTEREVWSLV